MVLLFTVPGRVRLVLVRPAGRMLPGGVSYAVSTQASSGSVTVGVPRSAGAAYRVPARLDMARLQLLPA